MGADDQAVTRIGGWMVEPALDEPLMTADEVAAVLGVRRKFVYARQRAGELRGYKLGRQLRFRPADVRAFLEACLAAAAAPREPAEVRNRLRRTAPAGSFRELIERQAA